MTGKQPDQSVRRLYILRQIRSMLSEIDKTPGTRLPGERELAQKYGTNRMLIRSILGDLEEDGLIYRIQGKGTFVREQADGRPSLGIVNAKGGSYSVVMKRQGISVENRVIGMGQFRATDFIRKRLCLSEDDTVVGIYRVRCGNNIPCAVEYTYLPAAFFPDILRQDFSEVSLYDYMRQRGCRVVQGPQALRVVPASGKNVKYLELPPGHPVYYMEFRGKTAEGTFVEYTESYVRPDKTEIQL